VVAEHDVTECFRGSRTDGISAHTH